MNAARETIKRLADLHSLEDVLILIAHDCAAAEVIEVVPKRINGWSGTNLKARIAEVADKIEKADKMLAKKSP